MPRDPKKINNYVVWDTETGGLLSSENPLMSVALVAINGVTLEDMVRYDDLVAPYDENLYYDPNAMAINGLTKERCEKEGLPLKQIVENICQVSREANPYKTKTALPILVAHNAKFDDQFFLDIFERVGVDPSKYFDGKPDHHGIWHPNSIDTVHWAKGMHAPLTEHTDNFKLGTCCNRHGISFNGDAHTAIGDTVALADLFRYFLTRMRSGSSEVVVTEGKAVVNHRNKFEW